MKRFLIFFVVSAMVCSLHADTTGSETASEVILDIYNTCVSKYSFSCVKPKALSWISQAVHNDVIKVTNDLSIVKTGEEEPSDLNDERSQNPTVDLFNKIDSFLSTHTLKIEVPELLRTKEARAVVPESYLKGGLAEGLQVPLAAGNIAEGRGFIKKVMVPFMLGLKFKTTVMVPLVVALIAIKTWKAMTLGLLSIVMTVAMVIFKFAKPKVYEIVHYPQHYEHHVEHPPQPWQPPTGWARQMDAQQMAFSGQL